MFYFLFVWQIVASAGTSSGIYKDYAWVNQGKFQSEAECKESARLLNIKHFRCIPTALK